MNRNDFETSLTLNFWEKKSPMEVRSLMGYETARMVHFDQKNPHHCYDLFMHTLHVMDGLGADAPVNLKIAAFFHDIGKPKVARMKQGRQVFYGHAAESGIIAEALLRKMGYIEAEIEEICFYIIHHDDFISWTYEVKNQYMELISEDTARRYLKKKLADEKIRRLYEDHPDLWKNLLCLCMADAGAQAKIVLMDGKQVSSKAEKQEKLQAIRNLFERAGYITP